MGRVIEADFSRTQGRESEGRPLRRGVVGGIHYLAYCLIKSHSKHARTHGYLDGQTTFGTQISRVRGRDGGNNVHTRHFWKVG